MLYFMADPFFLAQSSFSLTIFHFRPSWFPCVHLALFFLQRVLPTKSAYQHVAVQIHNMSPHYVDSVHWGINRDNKAIIWSTYRQHFGDSFFCRGLCRMNIAISFNFGLCQLEECVLLGTSIELNGNICDNLFNEDITWAIWSAQWRWGAIGIHLLTIDILNNFIFT